MRRLTRLGEGEASILFLFEPRTGRLEQGLADHMPEPGLYLEHFAASDPRYAHCRSQPAGATFTHYAAAEARVTEKTAPRGSSRS